MTSKLLLCEGTEDASFLRKLIESRSIGSFDVRPVIDLGGIGGVSGFGAALIAAVGISGFRKFEHIILIGDCDTHHRSSFDALCQQLRLANKNQDVAERFEIPTEPHKTSGGRPRVTILLIPEKKGRGGLETLMWSALKNIPANTRVITSTDKACESSGISSQKWGASKFDKARVRIFMALSNRENPAVSLSKVWHESPSLIPIDSVAFDQLAASIRSIS